MKLTGRLREATFLERKARFLALVELEGEKEMAYLPNSGRMEELLVAGRTVLLVERPGSLRKTSYDLTIVCLDRTLVWVDSRTPCDLLQEALTANALPHFQGYTVVRREASFGESRIDFLLQKGPQQCFLEAKSVTLVNQGKALFPDAPTQRGTRHLRTLIQAMKQQHGAAISFVIQREDARSFSPNDAIDPQFGRVLREAAEARLQVYAYTCQIAPGEIRLHDEVGVFL